MDQHTTKEEVCILEVRKVYDPFLRILHCWNGLSIFSLMLTIWLKRFIVDYPNGKEILYRFHILIGYALTIGIFARLIWGFIGCRHAKFKNMFYFRDWVKIFTTRKYDNTPHWGHDRYASLFYLFFYFIMIYQVLSGLFLAAKYFQMGPLTWIIPYSKVRTNFSHSLKQIHEIVFYASMIYVVLHVGMLIFHGMKGANPVAQSMLSGFQYRRVKK